MSTRSCNTKEILFNKKQFNKIMLGETFFFKKGSGKFIKVNSFQALDASTDKLYKIDGLTEVSTTRISN